MLINIKNTLLFYHFTPGFRLCMIVILFVQMLVIKQFIKSIQYF